MSQAPTYERQIGDQRASAQHRASSQSLARVQEEILQETTQNPDFLEKLGDADVDNSDVHDWITDELGPALSEALIKGNMDEDFPRRAELLNQNAADRFIAERTPGRCLRQHEKLNALAQGITGTRQYPDPTDHPDYRAPLTPAKKRVVRAAFENRALLQSLSAEGEGVKAVSTATTENRTVGQETADQKSIRERAAGVFK
jgi:hypothetical protein